MLIFPRPLVLFYFSWNYFLCGLFSCYSSVVLPVHVELEMSTFSVTEPIIKYFCFKMTWKNTLLNSENLVMHLARLNDK